jgi:hypothetical protein
MFNPCKYHTIATLLYPSFLSLIYKSQKYSSCFKLISCAVCFSALRFSGFFFRAAFSLGSVSTLLLFRAAFSALPLFHAPVISRCCYSALLFSHAAFSMVLLF